MANSVDPDHTAPEGSVLSESARLTILSAFFMGKLCCSNFWKLQLFFLGCLFFYDFYNKTG